MTAERYIETCKQLGVPVDERKMPPHIEDFPTYVHAAMNLFNILPDTYSGGMEPIFSGKDFSALPTLFNIYNVEEEDYRYIMDVILILINYSRKKAVADAKKASKSK